MIRNMSILMFYTVNRLREAIKNNPYSDRFSYDVVENLVENSKTYRMYPDYRDRYEFIINWTKEYNDKFDIIISFLSKKYNICDDILQLIGEYYDKYEFNTKTLDSSIIENIELTKQILSLNKTKDINVVISLNKDKKTIPLLYYLVYKEYSNDVLEYFLKIGCNPNIKYKQKNNIYGKLIEYDSLLEYFYSHFYDLKTIKLIKKYGGRM